MQGAKEFYQYCIAHPEEMERLQAMEPEAMAEAIRALGYEFSKDEFRALIEDGEVADDDMLAAATSGGWCTGHCGRTCERDCASGGRAIS